MADDAELKIVIGYLLDAVRYMQLRDDGSAKRSLDHALKNFEALLDKVA